MLRRLPASSAPRLVYLAAVVLAAYAFTHWRFAFNLPGTAGLAELVAGSAPTPFQYRALIPWLVGGLLRLLPDGWLSLQAAFWLIEFGALIALALAFRSYLAQLLGSSALTAALSLSVFYVLPFHFIFPRRLPFYYPSDVPSVVFFTLGLIFLRRRRWWAYYLLLAVATLNRETAIFLIGVYVATALGQAPRRELVVHTGLQAAVWVAIKLGLYWLYRGNPGLGLFESQWLSNLKLLTEPQVLADVASLWGYVWVLVVMLFGRIPDRFVRRSLAVAIPYLLGLAAVGVVFEMRIYADLIPLMLAAFWLIVVELARGGAASRLEPAAAEPPISVQASRPAAGRGRLNVIAAGLGAAGLLAGALALFALSEQQLNEPIAPVRLALIASLEEALAAGQPDERTVIVNWPESVRVAQPVRLFGLVPFTLPAMQTAWRDAAPAGAELVQYAPWQAGGDGVRAYFTGRFVTESELVERIVQADRTLDFHAASTRMYSLAERLAPQAGGACRARFGAAADVCLVEGLLTQQGGELRLDLIWRVARSPDRAVTTFVHVFDASGALAAQADGDPVRNLLPLADWPGPDYVLRETRWAARPAGRYQVRVGLYDRATGERWEAACSAADTCSSDGLVLTPLATFP